MLKSKTVAKLIETTLNWNDKGEKFRVVYEVGSYKGADINCVLKQGKGTITPIANYTNVKTPFTLEIIVPMQCGEDRVDTIVDIVNGLLAEYHGKVKKIDNGRAMFLFSPLEIGNYETRATTGQSVLIKVDLSVEYSTNVGTKYEMALINNPFDYGTQNVRRFNNVEEQIEWINNRIDIAPFYEILTPNINSLVITQQRYLNPGFYDANDLLMKNYAIIKETKWNDDVNYYFYYVTNSNLDQYNIPVFDLAMDTIGTFYNKIEFGDCFISKADINRWIDNEDGTVSFDTRPESELFEREEVTNITKRLIKRDVMSINNTGIDQVDKWLNENVLGWIYVYVDSKSSFLTGEGEVRFKSLGYKHYSTSSDATGQYLKEASLYNSICCLAFPVMKTRNNIIISTGTEQVELGKDGINNFLGYSSPQTESNVPKIYAMKFSLVMPIYYINEDAWEIDTNNNLVFSATKKQSGWQTIDAETNQPQYHTYNVYIINGSNPDWDVQAVKSVTYGGFLNVVNQINLDNKIT